MSHPHDPDIDIIMLAGWNGGAFGESAGTVGGWADCAGRPRSCVLRPRSSLKAGWAAGVASLLLTNLGRGEGRIISISGVSGAGGLSGQ